MKRNYKTGLIHKDNRYLSHLSEDENKMLDTIADIIVGRIMRKRAESQIDCNRQSELNQYCADSESIVCREKLVKKKALETQALSILYARQESIRTLA